MPLCRAVEAARVNHVWQGRRLYLSPYALTGGSILSLANPMPTQHAGGRTEPRNSGSNRRKRPPPFSVSTVCHHPPHIRHIACNLVQLVVCGELNYKAAAQPY